MDRRISSTVSYYDKNAQSWADSHGGSDTDSWWAEEMRTFHDFLPSGSVIEIGAGNGKDAQALIKLGYDYTGTDASIGMLKLAEERNPSATFIQRYVHELDPSIGIFDGFWASAVLLHIPREQIEDSLRVISSLLVDNGVGFITMREGEGGRIDKGKGRIFTFYSEEEFTMHLNNTGFTVLKLEKRITPEKSWLIYYVKKC